MNQTFTTVILQEGKWFVARCVELGVVSQGKTIEQAEKHLREAVELFLDDAPKRRRSYASRAALVTTMQIQHG